MKKVILLHIFYALCIVSGDLSGQSFSSLPKVVPSYSQDFSHFNSHPSLCVDNVFFDDRGRMWLSPCVISNLIKPYMMQFTGYDFRLVGMDFQNLTSWNDVLDLIDGNTVIGYKKQDNESTFFWYDLQTSKTQYYDAPIKGKVDYLTHMPNGQIIFLMTTDSEWVIYEMVDSTFVKLDLMKDDYRTMTTDEQKLPSHHRFFDGNVFWTSSPGLEAFERIDLNTGHRKVYKLPHVKDVHRAYPEFCV